MSAVGTLLGPSGSRVYSNCIHTTLLYSVVSTL